MGAFLFIIHPELYQSGRNVFRKIAEQTSLVQEGRAVLEVLEMWTTPFSGYSLVSNRETPFHRDNYSRTAWFDFLTTIGTYASGRLLMPDLDIELQYDSGTMVALLGKILRHGVTAGKGSRLCIAQFMRDNVHERVGERAPGWAVWGYHPIAHISGVEFLRPYLDGLLNEDPPHEIE